MHSADAKVSGSTPPLFTPIMGISLVVALCGIWLAYNNHLKNRPAAERIARELGGLTEVLEGKYWIDEIYTSAIVEPLKKLGRASRSSAATSPVPIRSGER